MPQDDRRRDRLPDGAAVLPRCTAAVPDHSVRWRISGSGSGIDIRTVDPPGSEDPAHRHDAHAFVYVLEGSIVMGVRGSEPVTLTAGQTFYEGPDDIHTIGRNASLTEPAKFVVVLFKNADQPILTPLP